MPDGVLLLIAVVVILGFVIVGDRRIGGDE